MVKTPIYFDHAATTPVDKRVLDKMIPYFTDVFGNANSQHVFGREAVKAVDQARDTIASITPTH
jgi:cysteine desulfurase